MSVMGAGTPRTSAQTRVRDITDPGADWIHARSRHHAGPRMTVAQCSARSRRPRPLVGNTRVISARCRFEPAQCAEMDPGPFVDRHRHDHDVVACRAAHHITHAPVDPHLAHLVDRPAAGVSTGVAPLGGCGWHASSASVGNRASRITGSQPSGRCRGSSFGQGDRCPRLPGKPGHVESECRPDRSKGDGMRQRERLPI